MVERGEGPLARNELVKGGEDGQWNEADKGHSDSPGAGYKNQECRNVMVGCRNHDGNDIADEEGVGQGRRKASESCSAQWEVVNIGHCKPRVGEDWQAARNGCKDVAGGTNHC